MDDSEKPGLRLSTPESIPFYEIQRRASELRNPYVLLNFLAHFQFGAAEHQEIFASFLPAWARMWKDHPNLWIDLLAEFDLPVEWQRIFAISPYWLVRYALAVSSGVATELLTMLASDGNLYVSAAARWYLRQR